MSSLPITPPTSARAATAQKSASPPPGSTSDFAALLDQTSARTASAEGPKNRPAQPESRNRDTAAPQDDTKGTTAAEATPAPGADPPPAQPQPVADSTRGLTPSGTELSQDPALPGGESAHVAAPVVADSTGGLTPSGAELSQGLGVVGEQAGPMVAATSGAVAMPGQVAGAAAAEAPVADACAAPADGTPAGKLQIPAELLNAKADPNGGQAKDFKNGDQPQRDLPPAPTLPPTADAAAAPATTPAPPPALPAEPEAAVAPAPTVAPQAQPVAMPQADVAVANRAPQLTRGSVVQTAERVEELVRIAATRAGNARAILQLRPAELGQVDVHLRTTRDGLVATISAHEQVGLDALQQAANELRRTLDDRGVQLHSLDLQLGTGNNGFSNQGDAREASSGRRGAAASHGLGNDDPVAAEELTITHAPSVPAGALVDVQA